MSDFRIRRALISVYDKTGVVEFARVLHDEFGVDIISTGGTAALLKEQRVPVTMVEEITGVGEMLDGRVKTLHPKIHAAILADRDNPGHMQQLADARIEPIDLVVVNLYPFEETVSDPNCTFDEAIEMIDIGGPCMLRAAAKNHKHVAVVVDPDWWEPLLEQLRGTGTLSPFLRAALAADVFDWTQEYDSVVHTYLESRLAEAVEDELGLGLAEDEDAIEDEESESPYPWFDLDDHHPVLHARLYQPLRYGENPHQRAALFVEDDDVWEDLWAEPTLPGSEVFGDTEMSYNNYGDAHAALELCKDLARSLGGEDRAVCCFVKHTNACGAAIDADLSEAYRKAYLGDPNAAMGGILAVSRPVDGSFAETVMATYDRWGKGAGAGGFFVEVWIAPDFTGEAVQIIRARKTWGRRVRLHAVGDLAVPPAAYQADLRTIAGGVLAQSRDLVSLNEDAWKVVSERSPSGAEMADLRLAWLICKHTRSNAITVCRDGMLLGNGAGQMSRVMSCRIATWLAKENGHAERLNGAVAASDAFFPFRDGPDILIDAGVRAIIQPGGSKRDEDTIAACRERDVAAVFTQTRHFRH